MEIKTPASNPALQEQFLCKNRLQEFTQRSGMPLPSYQTVNEGYTHAPKFRATVIVDGVTFTSPHTFPNRKSAEQDVAKLALESLSRRVEYEGASMIEKDILFCKSILHEYAVKMKLAPPTYKASKPEGTLSVFSATSFFNGQSFVGDSAKSKKEAEQLAARAVIQSALANPNTKTVMCQIIQSKGKLFSVFSNMGSSSNLSNTNVPLSHMQDNYNDDVKGKVAPIEIFDPEVKISNQGYICELSVGTNGNGSSQSALSQGRLQVTVTPSLRKWSDELEGGSESKKARTIEQLQTPPANPSRQPP